MTFQSTLPRGSDAQKWEDAGLVCIISIHAPSRERLPSFKTRTSLFSISIHAPSRERRLLFRPGYQRNPISIHAPSRERQEFLLNRYNFHYFNPRSLAGATRESRVLQDISGISIHAPSRERHNHILHLQMVL